MTRTLAALLLIAVTAGSVALGQPGTPDRITFRDKKDGKAVTRDGELKAGAVGYQVVAGGKAVATVGGNDIVRVVPGDLPGIDRTKDVFGLLGVEDNRDFEKARAGYAELLKAPNLPEKTKRYLEFKLATTTARVADDTPDDGGWAGKADEAAKLLDQFLVTYPNGWELWPVGRTAARLRFEAGKFDAAAQGWGKLAKSAELPADLRQEAALAEIDALIREKRYPVAAGKIEELAKAGAAGSVGDRLAIYRLTAKAATGTPADGVPAVEAEIAKTKDNLVRAVGYSMLGELFLAAERPRDAMWSFLWVDTVYTQDRDEVVKAMARLARVFAALGDDDRAKAYRDKLRRYRANL